MGGYDATFSYFNRVALKFDETNHVASFLELDHRSGGAWGLKNVIFEKDAELFELFLRFGEHSKAQILQDLAFLKFFPEVNNNGYFVEVGVGDGIHVSNSYLFEKKFGWDGLLIEPNPVFGSLIPKNRSAKLDTRAANLLQKASAEFLVCSELSRLVDSGHDDHHKREGETTTVATATLSQILDENAAPKRIQFMSIDTEGTEYDVLRSLDFTKYHVDFLTIEHNYNKSKQDQIRKHMEILGYKCVSTTASLWDDWFVLDAKN